MSKAAIVLAAGAGTRMKSALPKVLHKVACLPLLGHVVGALRAAGVERIVVVTSPAGEAVRDYAFSASVPWPQNIALFERVKKANGLKFGLISNEGQGVTEYRMSTFGLREVADIIVVSHCVHMRKPDRQMWQLALDLAQVTAEQSIYVDDREMFVNVAATLGFTAFQHVDLDSTREKFARLGLTI